MGITPTWYWHTQPLAQRTGTQVFQQLQPPNCPASDTSPARSPDYRQVAVLLESPYPLPETSIPHASALARYSLCAGPPRYEGDRPQVWVPPLGQILPTLRQTWRVRYPQPSIVPAAIAHLPFTGGWLGWFGSDLATEIEYLPSDRPDPLPFPPAFWYEPQWFAVLDHRDQVLWLAASTEEELATLQTQLDTSPRQSAESQSVIPKESLREKVSPTITWHQTAAEYEAAVCAAQRHIQAGDIFQANLSLRFAVAIAQDGWAVYQRLHQINPSPFASYWRTPWGEVVSCSPERLVQVRDRQVQTRPIAGTRPRGQTVAQDQAYAAELLSNRKEQAEHIMLVDLERNDLGRVCTWGSVQVDELLTIERYSHVMHLVSNVVGTLPGDRDWVDVVRAVFPGGTITGCPKVRCMGIIAALEPVRRSLFYGSCGYLDQRGYLDLNILIRTLLVTPNPEPTPTHLPYQAWGQVGAGIVADSDPHQEWVESGQKARAQLLALMA